MERTSLWVPPESRKMSAAPNPLESFASAPLERPRPQGAYDLLVTLGSGGMGEVFLASRRGRDGFRKMCVVKKLRPNLEHDEQFRTMFSREGRIAARMNHPNVVSTDEIGEHDGALYLAMEYLEGQTLRGLIGEVVAGEHTVSPLLWVSILCDVLEGLHYIHELRDFDGSQLGLVHGDVSPHNVCLTYDGRVSLIDFGSAVITRDAPSDRELVTGKLGYMSPECVACKPYDRRSDIYSAGIVLWELLAGMRVPRERAVAGMRPKAIPPLSAVMEEISPDLEAIVARAVSIDQKKRYPTAAAMRRDLEGFLERSRRPVRRSALTDLLTGIYGDDRRELDELTRERIAKLEMTASGVRPMRPSMESFSDQMTVKFDRSKLSFLANKPPRIAVATPAVTANAAASQARRPTDDVAPRTEHTPIPMAPAVRHAETFAPGHAHMGPVDDTDVFLGTLARARQRRMLAALFIALLCAGGTAFLVMFQLHFGE